MQCLEVSCAVRPIYGSLGAKGLNGLFFILLNTCLIKKGHTNLINISVRPAREIQMNCWMLQLWALEQNWRITLQLKPHTYLYTLTTARVTS
jgi:hypothetical protein